MPDRQLELPLLTDAATLERQERYRQRKADEGWKRLSIWVPASHIKRVRAALEKMKEAWA